jgi:3-phosphoshikimate 1-carboxyvinyltransferase
MSVRLCGMGQLTITPLSNPPDSTVTVPGSKSVTNRAILIGGLAAGSTTIRGLLVADDTEAMIDAVSELGAEIVRSPNRIDIVGIAGRIPRAGSIFARRSGTTARFVAPVLAFAPGPWTLEGDPQLASRPMEDLYRALESVGAHVQRAVGDLSLPVIINGPIKRTTLAISGSTTSQFLSGLLLAAPLAAHGMTIEVDGDRKSKPYIDLTVRTMREFGAHIDESESEYRVAPGGYVGREMAVEPDASTASYFYAAAAVTGGRVRVSGLSRASIQGDIGFVDLLAAMGVSVTEDDNGIVVSGSGRLAGITVDASNMPDIVPTLAVVAAFASSRTVVTGVGFTRGHESDRVGGLVAELVRCGVEAREEEDGLVIEPGAPHGARVHTHSDHRMAMAFAVLGLVVPGVELDDPQCVDKTFPEFFETLEGLRR